eukprot:360328-Chlamydomonas_euryale.AAC.6
MKRAHWPACGLKSHGGCAGRMRSMGWAMGAQQTFAQSRGCHVIGDVAPGTRSGAEERAERLNKDSNLLYQLVRLSSRTLLRCQMRSAPRVATLKNQK